MDHIDHRHIFSHVILGKIRIWKKQIAILDQFHEILARLTNDRNNRLLYEAMFPPYVSFCGNFDMAKSAWLSSAPAEFTRINISVTVSISRSSQVQSPDMIIDILRVFSRAPNTTFSSTPGYA